MRLVVARSSSVLFISRITFHALVSEPWVHIGTVDRRVAARRPTGTHLQEGSMIRVADQNGAG